MDIAIRTLLALSFALLIACNSGPKGSAGFALPDGDASVGKTNYLALQCNACHQMAAVAQLETEEEPDISVAIGGKTTRIRTYGELVTSIINPSHRLARGYSTDTIQMEGQSRMKNYNDEMTVSELIDLVAFVQSSYEIEPIQPPIYRDYGH